VLDRGVEQRCEATQGGSIALQPQYKVFQLRGRSGRQDVCDKPCKRMVLGTMAGLQVHSLPVMSGIEVTDTGVSPLPMILILLSTGCFQRKFQSGKDISGVP
jgi:hypothetical protein